MRREHGAVRPLTAKWVGIIGILSLIVVMAVSGVAAQSSADCFVFAAASGQCILCNPNAVSLNSCADEGFRVCSSSKEACEIENYASGCFVRDFRNTDGSLECASCPTGSVERSQCVALGRRWCYRTLDECLERKFYEPTESTTSPGVSTTEPVVESSASTELPTSEPLETTAPSERPTEIPLTTEPPTTTKTIVEETGCWAPENWTSERRCLKCHDPTQGFCPEFTWTECYTSLAACESAIGSSGGGGGGVDVGTDFGGEGSCNKVCSDSEVTFPPVPAFRGPNCYDSQYGAKFGPSWKPSGKTSFEKLVKLEDLFKLLQTTDDAYPVLPSWGVRGCTATAVIYRNIVCSLELLEGKQFEGTNGGKPGYFTEEIFNTGNRDTDLLEVAAFISHKMKETGRLSAWEEKTGATYYDAGHPGNPNQSYHGRGPVQISWNFNYGPFSQWFFGDAKVLLNDPSFVDPEGPMGFVAAFWFWATPRQFTSGAPISGFIRTRDAIIHWADNKMNSYYGDGVDYDRVAGLGLSTNVINGGIECTGHRESADYRVAYFLTILARLGGNVPPEISDRAACSNNKFCNGLFSGCRATAPVVPCSVRSTDCGPSYLLPGWQGHSCRP